MASAQKMKLDLSAPHQRYTLADGSYAKGVTTVLDVLAKQNLLDWYPRVEREGIVEHVTKFCESKSTADGYLRTSSVYDAFLGLPKWPSGKPKWFGIQSSRAAADLGTVAHAHIEAWLTGRELDPEGLPEGMWEAALPAFDRFKAWWDGMGLELVASEWQGVSEAYRYGGTIDFVARKKDGGLLLGDIKTSKANKAWPYPTVIAQVAAYRWMWQENGKGDVGEVHVVRVGKTPEDRGQYVRITDRDLDAGWTLFKAARAACDALEVLER